MATNVKACYNKIKEQMLSHTTIPSYAVGKKDTPTKKKMTTNSDGTFTITLTDSKNVSKYYDWQTAIKNYSYLSITTDTEGKLVIKSTKPIPSGSAITLTAERNSSKYQNNIVDVAPMYMISGSGSQSSATFVTDRDPSTAKIAIYSDSLGTAQIKKVWEHKKDSSSTQASNSDIYFTIKNSSGSAVKATGKAGSYTYSTSGSVSQFKLNSSNTFLVKSLPAGTYTVTEHGKNSDGSIPYYTRTGGVSKTVTVTAGGTGTVTFTNTRNTGTGEVIKTWIDTNGNTISASSNTERNQQIYFRIKNADNKYIMIAVNGDGIMSRYAFCRSVSDRSTYRVDLPGSDKKYSFSLLGTNKNKLYVFESVIDMLSYASFYAINNGQDAWQQLTMLSLGGKSDVALDEFLKNKPIAEITFCLDNDDAGKHATEQLSDKYALKGYAVSKDIPLNKDFNDDLKAFRALNEKNTVQATKPLKR